MAQNLSSAGLGSILATLAAVSKRPKYACLVLQLVAEKANNQGKAGPFITIDGQRMVMRDWLCTQLMPMSEQHARRKALRDRVTQGLHDRLTGDVARDAALIEMAIEEHVLEVGRANVSRAISELVKAGLITRHYAGYATNHENRGGRRHAVYVLRHSTMSALGRAPEIKPRPTRQGELFAA